MKPAKTAKRKDLITLEDVAAAEFDALFQLALKLKAERRKGKVHRHLEGKNLAMIFQKPSTRTRVSFEMGMRQLGGHGLFLSGSELQLGRGETISDTAQVLSRYVDGIMARVFAHSDIEGLARHASIPVINGLSDYSHPCQGLADYLTILEHKGRLKGLTVAYVGDGNNVTHSLFFGGAKLGVNVVCVCPKGFEPDAQVVRRAQDHAKKTGAVISVTDDLAGVVNADVIYGDVWASMGQESEHAKRVELFKPYQVDSRLMARTGKPDTLFMHCLPAHRGEEVSAEVMDGKSSIVFDQAENRLHAQKAVLVTLMAR